MLQTRQASAKRLRKRLKLVDIPHRWGVSGKPEHHARRRVLDLQFAGLRAPELYRVREIADRLDVSVDWLVGRSEMEVPKGNGKRVA